MEIKGNVVKVAIVGCGKVSENFIKVLGKEGYVYADSEYYPNSMPFFKDEHINATVSRQLKSSSPKLKGNGTRELLRSVTGYCYPEAKVRRRKLR